MRILAAALSSLLALSPVFAATAYGRQADQKLGHSTQHPAGTQGQTSTQGQTTTKPGQAAQTTEPPPPQIPVSPETLNRIREAINRPSKLRIENGQMRIRVEVIAKWPSFAEIAKGYDLMNGPTGTTKGLYGYGNPMSHNEFLGMVTPREMYGSAGIQATELAVIGLVNYFGQKLVKKGIEELRNARNEKEIAEIRARIDRELEMLRNGGGGWK